jgi:hypothetical protein
MSTGKCLSYYCFDGGHSSSQHMRFDVFTAALMKIQVIRDIKSFQVVYGRQYFRGVCYLNVQDPSTPRRVNSTKKIDILYVEVWLE